MHVTVLILIENTEQIDIDAKNTNDAPYLEIFQYLKRYLIFLKLLFVENENAQLDIFFEDIKST